MSTNPSQGVPQQAADAQPQTVADHVNPSEDDFQGLFDSGAFEPSSNEGHAQREQVLKELEAQGRLKPADAPKAEEKAESESNDSEEAATEKDAKPEEKEEEAEEFTSIDDFLAKHKIDPESFRTLPVSVKVNGQETLVPLTDVLRGYQLDKVNTQKSQELSEARKAWDAERQAQEQLFKQQLVNARNLGEFAYRQLMGEFSQINWDHLKATDPVTWSVKSQEFRQRHETIQQHMQQVSLAQQAQEQEAQQTRAQALAGQREKMLEAHPEWRDEAKFKAAKESMTSYAKAKGFTDAELSMVHDARMMDVLHDAAQFRALQSQAPAAVKKVRAAPAMAKPGARQERNPAAVANQQLRERFMRNPADLDAQEAYFSTLA